MNIETKNCVRCFKSFKRNSAGREWKERKYCSHSCANKSTRTKEVRLKISKTCKENMVGAWMSGRERPLELRKRHSQYMKGIVALGKHNFWKGGISKETRSFKSNFQNTFEYRLWRTAVFLRDNYSCQCCGARNGNGKKVILNADHIKSFAQYPELRLAIDNGRTLCRECHYKRHSKKGLPANVKNIYGD